MKFADLPGGLLAERPHLFSAACVAVSDRDRAFMGDLIAVVEQVVALPGWQELTGIKSSSPEFCHGVFMGFDFHLTEQGPRLIEINTNAGGGLLAALQTGQEDVLAEYIEMFRAEASGLPLKTIAIIDEHPSGQFLYPEFLGFQYLFAEYGIDTVICDPADLLLCHGALWFEDRKIDLVYNRLTDFSLSDEKLTVLREGWLQGVRVTPNPANYARYADKRNLIALSDDDLLAGWGVDAASRAILQAGVPQTEAVSRSRADEFWQRRRQLFFKPATGYGSKGTYRGDKLTKRVFDEIVAGDYVAQAFAPPSTIGVAVDEAVVPMKVDVRNYVYRGKVQLVAARLYQGQTTNFRTPGGGFARVVGQ